LERLDATTKLTLVEVVPGLLSEVERDGPRERTLAEGERGDVFPANHALPGSEAFQLRGVGRRAVDDRPRAKRLAESLEDHRFTFLHAEREELDDEDVFELVDNQAGKPVALRVNDAIPGGVRRGADAEGLARGQRTLETRAKERRVDGRRFVTDQDPHRDRRPRRIEPATQEIPARIDDPDLRASCRAAFDALDGLGINPRMTGPNGLNVTGFQTNGSQRAVLFTRRLAGGRGARRP
jgi:hypothetical protein